MWYLRLLILLLINVVVVLFALANIGETITLRWWNPNSLGTPANLTAALLIAYLLGFLTFFLISAMREIRLRRRCGRLQRQLDGMREELNRLRTAPIDGPVATSPAPPPSEEEGGSSWETR
jgi:uncharacterized integral membrane protein